jgi:hypothetical protein
LGLVHAAGRFDPSGTLWHEWCQTNPSFATRLVSAADRAAVSVCLITEL